MQIISLFKRHNAQSLNTCQAITHWWQKVTKSLTAGLKVLRLELIDLYSFLGEQSCYRGINSGIEPYNLSNLSSYKGNSDSISRGSAFIFFFNRVESMFLILCVQMYYS